MCCRGGGRVPWAPLWLQEGAELSLAGSSLGSGSWRGAGCGGRAALGLLAKSRLRQCQRACEFCLPCVLILVSVLWPGVLQVGFPELYNLQRFAVLSSVRIAFGFISSKEQSSCWLL